MDGLYVRPTPTQPLVISKFIKASALVALVLIASFGAFAYYTAQQARYYQSELGPGLSREFGFTHGSPYVQDGDEASEVFTLHPTDGGPLSSAGVHDGDIVLSHSITGFYRFLHEHRGSTITFTVTDGGDGISIEHRPVRSITLAIPP